MKKSLFLLSFLIITSFSFSQDDDKKGFDASKVRVDGNVGVNIDNSILNISFLPLISHEILPKWSLGFGPNVTYVQNLSTSNSSLSYGGNIFTRYSILPELYLQAESEWLNFESGFNPDGIATRTWTNSILLGAGYNKSLGNGLNASLTFLYIVNYDPATSPYNNPVIVRGGINKSF